MFKMNTYSLLLPSMFCAAYFSLVIPSFNYLSDVAITKILPKAFKIVTTKFSGNPLLDNSHILLLFFYVKLRPIVLQKLNCCG